MASAGPAAADLRYEAARCCSAIRDGDHQPSSEALKNHEAAITARVGAIRAEVASLELKNTLMERCWSGAAAALVALVIMGAIAVALRHDVHESLRRDSCRIARRDSCQSCPTCLSCLSDSCGSSGSYWLPYDEHEPWLVIKWFIIIPLCLCCHSACGEKEKPRLQPPRAAQGARCMTLHRVKMRTRASLSSADVGFISADQVITLLDTKVTKNGKKRAKIQTSAGNVG